MSGWRHLTALALVLGSTSHALADPPASDGYAFGEDRLRPGLYPEAPVPEGFVVPPEPGHPPFDIDWSIGLRGTLARTTTGETFTTVLHPQFSATHDGRRADIAIDGSADIAKPNDGEVTFSAMRIGASGRLALDSVTTVTGSAALQLSQQLPDAPDLNPLVTQAPRIVTGSLGAGIDRQFGKFNLGLSGDAERKVYGASTRSDTGVTDNADQNYWSTDVGLRLGFQATPIFEVFGEARLGRDMFDTASMALGATQDATSKSLRAGLAGNWNSRLSASASVGVGEHDFDDASLEDVTTHLYDASITYRPDPTINLTAQLSTAISPPGADASGTARIEHRATAKVDYTVNSWLRLRASADWGRSIFTGSSETETRHGLGAGADYAVNAHTALSADYDYGQRDNSATGLTESHRVSVGITLRR